MNKNHSKMKIPILKANQKNPLNQINNQQIKMIKQNQILLQKRSTRSPQRAPKKETTVARNCLTPYSKHRFTDLYGNILETTNCNQNISDNLQHKCSKSHLARLESISSKIEDFNRFDKIDKSNLHEIKLIQGNENIIRTANIADDIKSEQYTKLGKLDFYENQNKFCEKCPICNERFGVKNIVVLSCGHKIHATCLMSFRRFSRQQVHKCPVCQKPYQFVEMKVEMEHHNRAAIQIQKVFRGYLFRKQLMKFIEPGSLLHRKWVLSRAEKASTRLASAIEDQSDAVDAILASIDKELDWARNVMSSVEIKGKDIDWNAVKEKIQKRWNGECPICLREIKKNECSITSCCHAFHTSCIQSWINYCQKAQNPVTCPVCRSVFQHQSLYLNSMPKLTQKILNF